MKRKLSKKTIGLTAAALMLTASVGVGSAMAYFTTYVTAEGGVSLELGATKTVPHEEVVAGCKEIVIENSGSQDCYVRMKALTGDKYAGSIVYSEPDEAGKWTPGADGYYYYSDIVPAKTGSTSQINVAFTFPEGLELPDFNVIIIQESTPVLYDSDGNPYADWNAKADVINPSTEPLPEV